LTMIIFTAPYIQKMYYSIWNLFLPFSAVITKILFKVWDWSKVNPDICYSVETMASIGRVVWCPDNNWHVASCFNMTDNSIHIWDIRRPYLPYAAFNDHNQLCTGIKQQNRKTCRDSLPNRSQVSAKSFGCKGKPKIVLVMLNSLASHWATTPRW
jgi:hypothetical protein